MMRLFTSYLVLRIFNWPCCLAFRRFRAERALALLENCIEISFHIFQFTSMPLQLVFH